MFFLFVLEIGKHYFSICFFKSSNWCQFRWVVNGIIILFSYRRKFSFPRNISFFKHRFLQKKYVLIVSVFPLWKTSLQKSDPLSDSSLDGRRFDVDGSSENSSGIFWPYLFVQCYTPCKFRKNVKGDENISKIFIAWNFIIWYLHEINTPSSMDMVL